jgi:hypothetical protein
MAVLRADIDFNFRPLRELGLLFPEFNGRLLSLIGSRARKMLKMNWLSGQDINLSAYPKDRRGNYTIVSDVNRKRNVVKIYSYTMNLFERGRMLRDGSKEAGKYTITKKLKMAVMSNTGSYITEFENEILKPEIRRIGL